MDVAGSDVVVGVTVLYKEAAGLTGDDRLKAKPGLTGAVAPCFCIDIQ